MYGIISCHRGDHPGPDHREVPSVASRAASRTRRVMISRNSRAYLRACMFRSLPVRESVRSQAGVTNATSAGGRALVSKRRFSARGQAGLTPLCAV